MSLLNIIMQYPYEILGALVVLPFVCSWAGAHIGARTGTSSAFRKAYQRRR